MSWLGDALAKGQEALAKAEQMLEKADSAIGSKIGNPEDEVEESKDLRDYVPRKARRGGEYVERAVPEQDINDDDLLGDLMLDEKPTKELQPASPAQSAGTGAAGDDWSDDDDVKEDDAKDDILGVAARKKEKEQEQEASTAPAAAAGAPEDGAVYPEPPASPPKMKKEKTRPAVNRSSSVPTNLSLPQSAGLAEALAENARLKKDLTKLNKELDDMDDRMIRAQDQLDKEKDVVTRTKRLARTQIQKMRDEMNTQKQSEGTIEKVRSSPFVFLV